MKPLAPIAMAIAVAGCSSSITTPQDITSKSEIGRQYIAYQNQMDGPSIEALSYFDVKDAIITQDGDLRLYGRFKIHNKRYLTDTEASMEFDVQFDNLGNDRIAIKGAKLTGVDINSIHAPIQSEVTDAAKKQGRKIAGELQGQVITGQTRLSISNTINEAFGSN